MHFSVNFNAREIENLNMREGHMESRLNECWRIDDFE